MLRKFSPLSIMLAMVLSASAKAESIDLPRLEVEASADASKNGLSLPQAGGQVAQGARVGILGNLDTIDTPFSVTSYTSQFIEDIQAASVGDVLKADPAVRVARGFGNFQQTYLVRGLPIFSDDMTYNGLYGLLPRQYLSAELVERVDVLRGANAFLNGAAPGGSGLGGAVNVVPKRAASEQLNKISAGLTSEGQNYQAADFSRRFADDAFGLRASIAKRGGSLQVDDDGQDLQLFSIGADYQGDKLRVSADFGYQDHQLEATQPSVTVAAGLAIPDAPDAGKNFAQPWTFSNAKDKFASLRVEYDLNDQVTAWLASGLRSSDESGNFANPTVNNASGDTAAYRFFNVREDEVKTSEAGLRFNFNTGNVSHQLVTSASIFDSKSRNAYEFYFTPINSNLYNATSVNQTQSGSLLAGGAMNRPLITERVDNSSFAIADSLGFFDDDLKVTVGLRRQAINTSSYDFNTGAKSSEYNESTTTPVYGVSYRLTDTTAVYANVIEGLVKGDTAPALNSANNPVANAGQALAPYKVKQHEIGIKHETANYGGSLSAYSTEKPVAGVDDNNVFRELSEQEIRGLELFAFGKPSSALTVLGGLSLMDSETDNKDSIGSPDLQANIGLDYALESVPNLTLTSRYTYTSTQYADADNTQKVPAWSTLDLGARYSLFLSGGNVLNVRAAVTNVTDEDQWVSVGGYPGSGYLVLGAPRTLSITTSLEF